MLFDPEVKIESERLYLRYLKKEDSFAIFENIMHDPEVLKYYIADYQEIQDDAWMEKVVSSYQKRRWYVFAVVLKENDEVIGMMNETERKDHETEIGYAIGRNYWNKGYTTEAMKAVVDYFFSIGFVRVNCAHIRENIPSQRVIQKSGLMYDYTGEKELNYHDVNWDVLHYHIDHPLLKDLILEKKEELKEEEIQRLIQLSFLWEQEEISYGLRANTYEDFKDYDVFTASIQGEIIGYLFSHVVRKDRDTSVMKKDDRILEIEEIYVEEKYRNYGIGKRLFDWAEEYYQGQIDFISLVTSTKDYRRILNFYIDKLGLNFYSASLFKKVN